MVYKIYIFSVFICGGLVFCKSLFELLNLFFKVRLVEGIMSSRLFAVGRLGLFGRVLFRIFVIVIVRIVTIITVLIIKMIFHL